MIPIVGVSNIVLGSSLDSHYQTLARLAQLYYCVEHDGPWQRATEAKRQQQFDGKKKRHALCVDKEMMMHTTMPSCCCHSYLNSFSEKQLCVCRLRLCIDCTHHSWDQLSWRRHQENMIRTKNTSTLTAFHVFCDTFSFCYATRYFGEKKTKEEIKWDGSNNNKNGLDTELICVCVWESLDGGTDRGAVW